MVNCSYLHHLHVIARSQKNYDSISKCYKQCDNHTRTLKKYSSGTYRLSFIRIETEKRLSHKIHHPL